MYFVNLHTASGKFIWHFLTCHSTITKISFDTSNFMSTKLTSSFSKYFQVSVPETEEREPWCAPDPSPAFTYTNPYRSEIGLTFTVWHSC